MQILGHQIRHALCISSFTNKKTLIRSSLNVEKTVTSTNLRRQLKSKGGLMGVLGAFRIFHKRIVTIEIMLKFEIEILTNRFKGVTNKNFLCLGCDHKQLRK